MSVEPLQPFHIATTVVDLDRTRSFYCGLLGCAVGREAENWIDFDFFGHQLSTHQRAGSTEISQPCGAVDGDAVPIPHFGAILTMSQWRRLRDRLLGFGSEVRWVLEPKIRFEGKPGEQGTFFILDPSGNALEFKGFADNAMIFAREPTPARPSPSV